MMSAFSFAMGLFPPGKGPETTPSTSTVEEKLKIQLPPWKELNPSLIPSNKDALPRGVLPVPVISIDPLYDDMFNKGMDHTCPAAFKRSIALANKNLESNSKLFDASLKKDLEKDFPLKDYYPAFAEAKQEWNLYSIGKISDEFKCYKGQMGEFPDKTHDFSWKFKYSFGIYMAEYSYTDPIITKLWTD